MADFPPKKIFQKELTLSHRPLLANPSRPMPGIVFALCIILFAALALPSTQLAMTNTYPYTTIKVNGLMLAQACPSRQWWLPHHQIV
jgi:hypothetical protein